MNAAELSRRLAGDAAAVAAYLLPGGKRMGGEWKAGSVGGEPGQSLAVRISGTKAGVWSDFASGEKGDLLDLWAAVRGLSIGQAIKEAKDYLGVRDDMPERQERSFKRPARPPCQSPKGKVREWLVGRGLTETTIEAFKVGEQVRDGKVFAVLPYLRDGELVNVKYRNVNEKRDMRQEGGAEPCLFGWHLIGPRTRAVAIAEGEIDAMSLHQCGVQALSVNAGAGNHQWIESDWHRLERFSEIWICFDADEAGDKGAQEVIRRLGIERCKRVRFPVKDANEWLQQGATRADFETAIEEARPQDPDELRSAGEFMSKVKALFYPAETSTGDPCLRLDKSLGWLEFRPGELSVWTGINGHGKSLLLGQVVLGLMAQGQRVVVFSGEMTPERQLKRLVKQSTGLDRPTVGYIDAVGEWMHDRLWIFNLVGSANLDRLLEVFAYANRRYGATQFVIDSLMMTDVPEDGPGSLTAQKEAVRKVCDFAKRNGCHVHLVAHPRKARDESLAPGKLDVAGSSKITDGADNVLSVWSARRDEAAGPAGDEPDGALELQKQRNGECQHFRLALWFVKQAQQFATNSRRAAVRYVDYEGKVESLTGPERRG